MPATQVCVCVCEPERRAIKSCERVSESRDVTPPRYAVSLDEPASSRWLHVLKAPGHDYNASLHASIGVITENKLFKEAEKLKQVDVVS